MPITLRFPPEFLDELRARLPVSEVVGRRVKLTKAGREWKGLSPFRKEKTPSFFVNDQKGAWFDFSSGQNGDIFDFVMATEGLTLSGAVERLAKLAGLPLPALPGESDTRKEPTRTDLRIWLGRQPYQVSIAYAARAALRSLPGLAMALGPRGGGARNMVAAFCFQVFEPRQPPG
jgi:hypothetical protein